MLSSLQSCYVTAIWVHVRSITTLAAPMECATLHLNDCLQLINYASPLGQ